MVPIERPTWPVPGVRVTGIGSSCMNVDDPSCHVRRVTNAEISEALRRNGEYFRCVFRTLRELQELHRARISLGEPEIPLYDEKVWRNLDEQMRTDVFILWEKYRSAVIPAEDDERWKQFEVDPGKIAELTGITQRYWVKPGIATSDLAVQAAQKALQVSGLDPRKVDLILVATTTPDHHQTPPTAAIVADKLGIAEASPWCLDLTSACTSFGSAVAVACGLIRSKIVRTVLVTGADVMGETTTSRFDRNVRIILGDGAFCMVLEACDPTQSAFDPRWFQFGSDGRLKDLIVTPAGGSALEITPIMLVDPFDQRHRMFMNGSEVLKRAQRLLLQVHKGDGDALSATGAIADALAKAGYTFADLDVADFHQANQRIFDPIVANMRRLGFQGVVHNNIAYYGNTTSASAGLCLDEAWQGGLIKDNALVVVVFMGGGMTTVVLLFRWTLGQYPTEYLAVDMVHVSVCATGESV